MAIALMDMGRLRSYRIARRVATVVHLAVLRAFSILSVGLVNQAALQTVLLFLARAFAKQGSLKRTALAFRQPNAKAAESGMHLANAHAKKARKSHLVGLVHASRIAFAVRWRASPWAFLSLPTTGQSLPALSGA